MVKEIVMIKKAIALSALLFLGGCTEQFAASKLLHSEVGELISSSNIAVSRIVVVALHDEASISVEGVDGVSIKNHIIFPRPNIYRGVYEITYNCEDKKCSLIYSEGAAEELSDSLIVSLFEDYVLKEVRALENKSRMVSNG